MMGYTLSTSPTGRRLNAPQVIGPPTYVKMDLEKAIEHLHAERERLERVIAALEELQKSAAGTPLPPKPTSRRGRKSMGSDERLQVSERMKKYWASRRKDIEAPTPEP